MSLIDQDFSNKNNEEKIECKECKKNISKDSPILLCENCFNQSINDTLQKINTNILQIKEEIKKINSTIDAINNDLKNKNLHIVVINRLEIDLLNFDSIRKKLEIDLELNKKAFVINQIQANKLREELKWTKFNIQAIDENLN